MRVVGNVLCPGALYSVVLYSKEVAWISEKTSGKIAEIEGICGFWQGYWGSFGRGCSICDGISM